MKHTLPIIFLLCIVFRATGTAYAFSEDSTIFSVDQPAAEGNAIVQRVNYYSNVSFQSAIRIRCVMITADDSLNLYDLFFSSKEIKAGFGSINLDFSKNSRLFHIDYSFIEVVKRFQVLPPGRYVTYLDVISAPSSDNTVVTNWYIDSTLSPFSTLRKDVNNTLENRDTKIRKRSSNNNVKNRLTERQFDAINNKIDRKVARKNQVKTRIVGAEDKRLSWFYYKKWCLGFYEIGPGMNERIKREKRLLKESPLDLVSTDLEHFTSVSSMSRKSSQRDLPNELTGSIDLISNVSTGRETGSVQDPNFQEVYGSFNTEIINIPVVIDGYYTTQDNKRTAKSSYIRLKYDRDRTKSDLMGKAVGFNNRYEDAVSKGVGYKSVYQGFLDRLVAEQRNEKARFASEYGVSDKLLDKYNGDVSLMISELDTSALLEKSGEGVTGEQLAMKRQKLRERSSDIERYYSKSKETSELITKYTGLLQQYEKQQYLDSALTYSKIMDVTSSPDMSTKQLGKAAEHILPPGKARSLLNSITKFELGVLNSYESDYTMSGQVLKGGTIGYDLGPVTLGASLGRTEYISRDGSLDRYSSTMIRADLKPTQKRKLGFIYYTCSPTRQVITDNTFIGDAGEIPSFTKPVSILAVPFEVLVSRDLSVSGEAAASYRNFRQLARIGNHNTAYKVAATYTVPVFPVMVSAAWEHVGKEFENAALPFPKAATERYTLATQATLFKSFLTAGVQFNHLKLESFSTTGKNVKWGFDLRSHSKRYPEVYVSYKPFSTFRSYDDTLAIAQRPMVGSVSIGRLSYQLKDGGVHHRLMLTYNSNSSIQEEIQYKSTTVQFTYMLTNMNDMLSVTVGWMKQPQFLPGTSTDLSSYLANTSYSRRLNKKLNVTTGGDIAIASYGLQRLGVTGGMIYSLQNKPLTLRLLGRYCGFRASEVMTQENLWTCMLACNWQIRPTQKKGQIQ